MNRRQLISRSTLALVASTAVWSQRAHAASEEPLDDYYWQFVDLSPATQQEFLYIGVERYWLGSEEKAHEAIFGEEPIESGEHPLNEATVEYNARVDDTRAVDGTLWGEEIAVIQVFCEVGEYIWIVTIDQGVPMKEWKMVVRSVFEFDEPRVPRNWSSNTSERLKQHD